MLWRKSSENSTYNESIAESNYPSSWWRDPENGACVPADGMADVIEHVSFWPQSLMNGVQHSNRIDPVLPICERNVIWIIDSPKGD